jgi:hypothetical protein
MLLLNVVAPGTQEIVLGNKVLYFCVKRRLPSHQLLIIVEGLWS